MDKEETNRYRPFSDYFSEEAWEHTRAARRELMAGMRSLFPADFFKHRRAARKEMLLAVRSVIDAALEKIDTDETSD